MKLPHKVEPCGKYKYKNSNGKEYPLHRLVMHESDPRPNEDELVVHHIDGDKGNNDPSNLIWMTKTEHLRYHRTGENHFDCKGEKNANYRHGQCVNGYSAEYKKYHNRKTYLAHREERIARACEYQRAHKEQKSLYDKIRRWKKALEKATTQERIDLCIERLKLLGVYE